MVFDRRFTAASPRYLGFDALLFGPKQKSDELRPPLLNPLVLLTRSFLMVLECGLAEVWSLSRFKLHE